MPLKFLLMHFPSRRQRTEWQPFNNLILCSADDDRFWPYYTGISQGLWLCFLATREPFRKAFGCYIFSSKAKNHRFKGHLRDWLFEIIALVWSYIKEANEHLALEWLEFQRLTQIGLCEKITKEERLLALYRKQQPPPTPLKILPLLLVLNAECTLELQNSFSAFLWSFSLLEEDEMLVFPFGWFS